MMIGCPVFSIGCLYQVGLAMNNFVDRSARSDRETIGSDSDSDESAETVRAAMEVDSILSDDGAIHATCVLEVVTVNTLETA